MSVAGYRAEVIQSLGSSEPFAKDASDESIFAKAVRLSSGAWAVDPDASDITGSADTIYDAWHPTDKLQISYDFSRVGQSPPIPVGYTKTFHYYGNVTGVPDANGEYRFGTNGSANFNTLRASTNMRLYATDSTGTDRTSELEAIPIGTYFRYVSPGGNTALFYTQGLIDITSGVSGSTAIQPVYSSAATETISTSEAGEAQIQFLIGTVHTEYDAVRTTAGDPAAGSFAFTISSTRTLTHSTLDSLGTSTNVTLSINVTDGAATAVNRADVISAMVPGDYVIVVLGTAATARWYAFEVTVGDTTGDVRTLTVRYRGRSGTTGTFASATTNLIFVKGNVFDSDNAIAYPAVEANTLFGWATVFGSDSQTPLRIKGNYLPKKLLLGANSFTLSLSNELLDDTDFSSRGWISRLAGLHSAGLSISRYEQQNPDFRDILLENQEADVLVEVSPVSDTTNPRGRGYFKIGSRDNSGDVNSLEAADLEYELTVDVDAYAADRFRGFVWSDED